MARGEVQPELVYAAYGRVMAKIGALEQFMRIALAQRAIDQVPVGGEIDTATLSVRLIKMDLGGLSQQVCDKFKLNTEMRQILKQAKDFRNHLAHSFWVSHFHNLQADRGRKIILRHCTVHEIQLEGIANTVLAVTGVDSSAYAAFVAGNSKRPEYFKVWEALLDRAEAELRGGLANHEGGERSVSEIVSDSKTV